MSDYSESPCKSYLVLCEDEQHRVRVGCELTHLLVGGDIKYHRAEFTDMHGRNVTLSWEEEITTPLNYVQVLTIE